MYNPRPRGMDKYFIMDHLVLVPEMKQKVMGQKPKEFCFWLFECLGMEPEDSLEDVFPGSGAVTQHWNDWKQTKINLFSINHVQEVLFD